MLVGIFSVRVFMQAVGVEDYGLSTVAGGLIGIFSFIIEGISTSCSRFITYELGRGDSERINATFNTCMVVFVLLGLTLVLLGETIGLWILTHSLNIPEGREGAAMIVYQLSIASVAIGLTQGPYQAFLTAHEKFNITATVSLINTFARLGLLYALIEAPGDHLVIYTVVMFCFSMTTLIYYRVYCILHWKETRLTMRLKRSIFRPMVRFSFWETFGAISRVVKGTGFPMVANMGFGVVINAAIGVGTTVSGAVTGMAFTVTSAFKPAILKEYAKDNIDTTKRLILNSTMLSMVFYGVFAIPLLVELDYVLHLWLTEVPSLTLELCTVQIVINLVLMAYLVPTESVKQMGWNKGIGIFQLAESIVTMGLIALGIRLGWSALTVSIIYAASLIPNLACTFYMVRRYLGGKFMRELARHTIFKVLLVEGVTFGVLKCVDHLMGPSIVTLLTVCALSVVITGTLTARFLLPAEQLNNLKLFVKARYTALRTA